MSYLVFARKWRPQSFDQVIAQEHVVTVLKNAITAGRLAHSYIFAGPRGVGKTSVARILAKTLNCKEGQPLSPCNKCPSCLEITASRSLDVIEIDGASNRGIDDIRALRENVKFSPAQGNYKVYIIDEVHQITSEGFNALLKTLEEPPAHVKFIFATTHPQKIPSTISSRCQFLEFRRIPNIEIVRQLKQIASRENIKADEDAFLALAKASDGSLRDAETMLDELVSFTGGNIRLEDVKAVLGVVEQEYLFGLTGKIIQKDTPGLLRLLDKLLDEGKDLSQLLSGLLEHYRNLMIVKVAGANQEKLLDMPADACQQIASQAKGVSLENILAGVNILLSAQEMAKRMDNPRIPLEIALVRLSSESKAVAPAQTAKEIAKDIPPPKDLPPEPSMASSPSQRHKEPQLDIDRIKCLWGQFLERMNKVKVSAAHYLEEGRPLKASGMVLSIGFPHRASFQKEALERKDNHHLLERVWKEILGEDIRIHFVLYKEQEPVEPREAPVEDPGLKAALDTFNGRVVRKG